MKKTLFSALALCMALASCTTNPNDNLQSILPGQWAITEASGMSTDNAESNPFIHFTDSGYVNGNTSVNNFFAQYTTKGDSIFFEQLGVTSRMGYSMDVEKAIIDAINNCVTLEFQDSILSAKDHNSNVVMTMKLTCCDSGNQ